MKPCDLTMNLKTSKVPTALDVPWAVNIPLVFKRHFMTFCTETLQFKTAMVKLKLGSTWCWRCVFKFLDLEH